MPKRSWKQTTFMSLCPTCQKLDKKSLHTLFHGGLYKVSNKDNPFVGNQVTTQNFMHLPYLGVELCSYFPYPFFHVTQTSWQSGFLVDSLGFPLFINCILSSFLTSRTQTHESGWNREVSNTPSHSTKILGKLICFVHANVDLNMFYLIHLRIMYMANF